MTALTESAAQSGSPAVNSDFLGHPRGLAYIAFTEAWERFSFYGMQALLMLYMTGHLLRPGTIEHVAGIAVLRGALEGLFGPMSVQIGRKRAVLAGAVTMAVGHFTLAFEAAFLMGLLALVAGSGLLKGNLAAQVGNLYGRDDRRRDSAYTVYVTAINVGAFTAPLVCGTLGELYSWHYGFAVAGFGMLISIGIYLAGSRYLPSEQLGRLREKGPRLQRGDGRILFAMGCAFYGGAYLLLMAGQLTASAGHVALAWSIGFHFLTALGYLYGAPVALALVTRAAPAAVNGMMAGAYYLGLVVGGIVSGRLARFYEPLQPAAFWGLHMVLVASGTVLLAMLRRPLARVLKVT